MANKTNNPRRNGKTNYSNTNKNRRECADDKREFNSDEDRMTNKNRKPKYKGGKGGNDPKWYALDAALLRDSSSIPFSWSQGTSIDTGLRQIPSSSAAGKSFNPGKFYVPGIMTFNLKPSIGYTNESTDPVNVASVSVYSYIRHANSGHTNYESTDLMCYLYAMTQAYSCIIHLQRLYMMTTMYSQRNRYLPRRLVEAAGGDFDNITSHLADFRYGINALINKISSMAVPNTFTAFNRAAFIYQHVYCEGTSVKDQMYMYVPMGFGKLGLPNLTNKDATCIYFEPIPTDRTVDGWLAYANSLINELVADEDMNIMSGDILKAYGSNIIRLAPLPEMVAYTPVFNIGVLEQMKNATITRGVYADKVSVKSTPTSPSGTSKELIMYQDVGSTLLKSHPIVTTDVNFPLGSSTSITEQSVVNMYGLQGNRLITTTTEIATPEIVIESSRLMTAMMSESYDTPSSQDEAHGFYCGTEFVYSVTIAGYHYDTNDSTTKNYSQTMAYFANFNQFTKGSNTTTPYYAFNWLVKSRAFDFTPAMLVFPNVKFGDTANLAIQTIAEMDYAYDLDNYAVLSPENIRRLHEAALLNMYNVPSIGKISG